MISLSPLHSGRKARLNEPANAGDASRATIWQGNCHVEDQLLYSILTRAENTIPIQYPISNCPAKPTGSFKRLYRKRAKAPCSRTFLRGCASDKALTFSFQIPLCSRSNETASADRVHFSVIGRYTAWRAGR